jgi:hypothetical protein
MTPPLPMNEADDLPALNEIVRAALARLEANLARALPHSAGALTQWQRTLGGEAPPERYFLHPLAFPSVRLPWWLESVIAPRPPPPARRVGLLHPQRY